MPRHTVFAILITFASVASAQSPTEYRHPIGLFADMVADTVTADLFNRFAPLDGWSLEAHEPVPGSDLFLDCVDAAAADFDQDGWTDVLLAGGRSDQDPPSRLLWGRPGGGFELVHPSPVPEHLTNVTRADLDGDGLTDVVALASTGGERKLEHDQYGTQSHASNELAILTNLGGRRFGVANLGVAAIDLVVADLDRDGWLDIAAMTVPQRDTGPRQVAILKGIEGGFAPPHEFPAPDPIRSSSLAFFQPSPPRPGSLIAFATTIIDPYTPTMMVVDPCGSPRWKIHDLPADDSSACIALGDADGDGRPDLFRGSMDYAGGRNRLYLDVASGNWHDQGRHTGLWGGYTYTYAAAWGDADNDGLSDLWQCRLVSEGRDTRSQLYWNRGDSTFVNATAALSRPARPSSFRAVWLDADQDGRLDLLATFGTDYIGRMPYEQCRPILYMNRNQAGNSLELELIGRPPNTDALGAVIKVWAGGRVNWRHIDDGSTSGGAAPPLVKHVGLGSATVCDSVAVWWPRGTRQVWRGLAAGRRWVLREQ